MSNNLGQIYATSKSANKYIVLESENVEVSGNFYVENNVDICGNLEVQGDVSFNSNVDICGNLEVQGDVSFNSNVDICGNLEVQGDASFNSNVDICGNLEVQGDASFNSNVDISGNLILKGSLGVLDSSTNDISYGNVDSVLTSNGSGALPSWRPPYLLTMTRTEKVNLTINTDTDLDFQIVTPYGSASASDWDIGNKEWTCPVGKGGLYHFVLQAWGDDVVNDSLEGWQCFIKHAPSGSSTFSKIAIGNITTGTNDDLASMVHNISRYYVVNAGDKIKGVVWVRVNASGGQVDFGAERTFLQIAKLI